MCSPEGDRNEGNGCYLEVVPHSRLVWTAALGPGFRPNDFSQGGFPFTAVLTFEPVEGGTKYTARVMHATAEANSSHAEMASSTVGVQHSANSSPTCRLAEPNRHRPTTAPGRVSGGGGGR